MDYFVILKTFWDEAPEIDGFKPDYAALFFAITDSVNRNLWKETEIEYDRIINKTKLGKRMYLAGRDWLSENNFISFKKGSNDYSRAKFNIAVRFCTTGNTANCTTTDTSDAPQLPINCTSTVPYLNKTIIHKDIKTINIPFLTFWDLYDKKKDRVKSEKKWNALSDKERLLAIEDIPKYLKTISDRQFQKDPATYLNNKCWLDERGYSKPDSNVEIKRRYINQ